MRGIGHALRVFFLDNDGAGHLGAWMLAALVMWLGYRHSRPDYTRPEHRD